MTTDSARTGTPSAAVRTSRGARAGAAVAHRWPTLLALVLGAATFADGLPGRGFLAALLVVMPVCYLLFGALRRAFGGTRMVAVQVAGLLVFGAAAAVAVSVGESAGLRLLAAGWAAHAVWDFVHHRTGRVVPRAWSEWCCVVDLCGAAALLAWS
ncbi:hypothetical protein SUDANB120_00419 [Streptomyces sp. enrichment culture]|uniref:hypothetical protein n=1 Tax=Streptomyces TaxID=1883 RepID=UPI0019AF6213|nr:MULTISPECIES: hypothetical protein [Streptomyces]GGT30924.1 hypothetical protein GCM10010286_65040 [Streptomyces toxytricini]